VGASDAREEVGIIDLEALAGTARSYRCEGNDSLYILFLNPHRPLC
jgi:hypothetical protein